jgi:hypothetical protein
MISDAIALYDLFIKYSKMASDFKIISAMFDCDGKLIEGNLNIKVNILPYTGESKAWFYNIEKIDDYVFIRIPVNVGLVIEAPGAINDQNPDSEYFRFVSVPDGHICGGVKPNVKVNFIVVGYRPKQLLDLAKNKL